MDGQPGSTEKSDPSATRAAAICVVLSVSLVGCLLGTMVDGSHMRVWAWLLTGLQVLAMWIAGSGRRAGWVLGASVQPAWIAYALLTDQEGFVLGCLVSAGVQMRNILMRAADGDERSAARATGARS